MPLKSLGQLEQRETHIIFMVLIIVLLWHGVWGLVEDLEHYLQTHYGFKKVYFNLLSILLAILVIGIFPMILEKL
jgi:succinate dehydrogenase hydrophobic anchor subunit